MEGGTLMTRPEVKTKVKNSRHEMTEIINRAKNLLVRNEFALYELGLTDLIASLADATHEEVRKLLRGEVPVNLAARDL